MIYFLFNLNGKLFFGESGIYIVSFLTSLLIIFGYKKGYFYLEQIILLLLIPGIDMIRVTIHRIINKISISKPDKNHLHHKLIKNFDSNTSLIIVVLLILPTNLISIFLSEFIFLLILINIFAYFFAINYSKNKYDTK